MSTFIYIVDSIYPSELVNKEYTESSASTSHLDVLMNIDLNGKPTTQLYEKWDEISFPIVNFPNRQQYFTITRIRMFMYLN